MFKPIGDSLATMLISTALVPLIEEYAGPDCENLKAAISDNIDIVQLYREQGQEATSWTFDRVQPIARRFKDSAHLITSANVLKWLSDAHRQDIVDVVHTERGGEEWLRLTLENVRRELFDSR